MTSIINLSSFYLSFNFWFCWSLIFSLDQSFPFCLSVIVHQQQHILFTIIFHQFFYLDFISLKDIFWLLPFPAVFQLSESSPIIAAQTTQTVSGVQAHLCHHGTTMTSARLAVPWAGAWDRSVFSWKTDRENVASLIFQRLKKCFPFLPVSHLLPLSS